jgi:hypothetical protein
MADMLLFGVDTRIIWMYVLWMLPVFYCHKYIKGKFLTGSIYYHKTLITECVTRLTRRVSLVEQELLTLPGHMNSPPGF